MSHDTGSIINSNYTANKWMKTVRAAHEAREDTRAAMQAGAAEYSNYLPPDQCEELSPEGKAVMGVMYE